MAWKETSPVFEKMKFIVAWKANQESFAELCRQAGVSRKTGYRLVARYCEEGEEAFSERSRAPKSCPWALNEKVREAILSIRRAHETWGPKKIRARLVDHGIPEDRWPALSTIGEVLRREGESRPQVRRRHACPRPADLASAPNEVMCADFKGWFRTQNGTRCDPLTVTDDYTRYLFCVKAFTPRIRIEDVKGAFIKVFRECGLPAMIKTDNGTPFAYAGPLGLTRLSAWWIQMGISPRRIEPGKPQQNGRHERMHRTLKEETAKPPAASLAAQQRRFDAFRASYNEERPHEGIGLVVPASIYMPSPRPYPETILPPEYGEQAIVRRVSHVGCIQWRKQYYSFTTVLAGQWVRVVPHEDEAVLSIIYYKELIGRIELKHRRVLGPDPGALPQTPEFSALRPRHEEKEKGEPL